MVEGRMEFVGVTEIRDRFAELARDVLPQKPVVLLKRSKAVAVLLSPERYDSLIERIEVLTAERDALAVRAGIERTRTLDEVLRDLNIRDEAQGHQAAAG